MSLSVSPPERKPPADLSAAHETAVDRAPVAALLPPQRYHIFLVGNPAVADEDWRRIVRTVFPRRAAYLPAIIGSLSTGGSILIATASSDVAETLVETASRLAEALGVPASLRTHREFRGFRA